MASETEYAEIRQHITDNLSELQTQRAKKEKIIAAFEAKVDPQNAEHNLRLDVMNKELDTTVNRIVDLEKLLAAIPMPGETSPMVKAMTWAGYLTWLEDSKNRQAESENIEIMRLASEKAKAKLYENHEYLDHTCDRAILNCDSVLLDDE